MIGREHFEYQVLRDDVFGEREPYEADLVPSLNTPGPPPRMGFTGLLETDLEWSLPTLVRGLGEVQIAGRTVVLMRCDRGHRGKNKRCLEYGGQRDLGGFGTALLPSLP